MKEAGLRRIQFWKDVQEKRVITNNIDQQLVSTRD